MEEEYNEMKFVLGFRDLFELGFGELHTHTHIQYNMIFVHIYISRSVREVDTGSVVVSVP